LIRGKTKRILGQDFELDASQASSQDSQKEFRASHGSQEGFEIYAVELDRTGIHDPSLGAGFCNCNFSRYDQLMRCILKLTTPIMLYSAFGGQKEI